MPIQLIYIFDSYVTVAVIDDIISYDIKYRSRDNSTISYAESSNHQNLIGCLKYKRKKSRMSLLVRRFRMILLVRDTYDLYQNPKFNEQVLQK